MYVQAEWTIINRHTNTAEERCSRKKAFETACFSALSRAARRESADPPHSQPPPRKPDVLLLSRPCGWLFLFAHVLKAKVTVLTTGSWATGQSQVELQGGHQVWNPRNPEHVDSWHGQFTLSAAVRAPTVSPRAWGQHRATQRVQRGAPSPGVEDAVRSGAPGWGGYSVRSSRGPSGAALGAGGSALLQLTSLSHPNTPSPACFHSFISSESIGSGVNAHSFKEII